MCVCVPERKEKRNLNQQLPCDACAPGSRLRSDGLTPINSKIDIYYTGGFFSSFFLGPPKIPIAS